MTLSRGWGGSPCLNLAAILPHPRLYITPHLDLKASRRINLLSGFSHLKMDFVKEELREGYSSNALLSNEPPILIRLAVKRKAEFDNVVQKKRPLFNPKPAPQPSKGLYAENIDCDTELTITLSDIREPEKLKKENGLVIKKDVLNSDECREITDGVRCSMEKITAGLNGLSMQTPEYSTTNSRGWHHVDQSYTRPEKQFFQPLVTARDACPGDYTTEIFVGSHKSLQEFEDTSFKKQDFNILEKKKQIDFYESRRKQISITSRAIPEKKRSELSIKQLQTTPDMPKLISRETSTAKFRHHVDQSYKRPEKEGFQSWATARDVCSGDYTTGFFVGSHKSFHELEETSFNITKKQVKQDFNILEKREPIDFYESRQPQIRITCREIPEKKYSEPLIKKLQTMEDMRKLISRETSNTKSGQQEVSLTLDIGW